MRSKFGPEFTLQSGVTFGVNGAGEVVGQERGPRGSIQSELDGVQSETQ